MTEQKTQESLTVKEALEQGYEHYLYNSDGFQSLKDIKEIEQWEFERDDIFLVKKESEDVSTMISLDSKQIAELLADHLQEQYHGQTMDDTNAVYDEINGMDFTDVEAKIKEALKGIRYYKATNIKLIP